MSDDDFETGLQLANELREIAQALIDHDVEPEPMRSALAAAHELRSHLTGPFRKRWYESQEPNEILSKRPNAFETLSPIRGHLNALAPPLSMEICEREDGSKFIAGRAHLTNIYEGPPRGVHGGFVAALFDEILSASMNLAPPAGVTAKLEVDYHHLTPIGEDLRLEAWIIGERQRRIYAEATCHAGDTLTARGKALFVRVDFKEVENRMRARGVG
ncbi:MAG: PaaI family thioesterase [bacterium]|nr:PaaI family thioesterase [bacterium]